MSTGSRRLTTKIMGQGYHSKVIFGTILTEAQSEIFNDLSDRQSDTIEEYFEQHGVAQSYEVKPQWFGVAFAATDELVARMNKIIDIGGGVEIQKIQELFEPSKIESARQAMEKIQFYLSRDDLLLKSPEFLLVTDYH